MVDGETLGDMGGTGDTITLKHGTGNIVTFDGTHPTITPTSPALLVRMGTNWVVIKNNASASSDVVSDTTPQLGGPLDANANQIQESLGTYSFASVTMTPNDDGNSYYFTDSGFTLTNIVIAPAGTEITIAFAATGTITPGGNLLIDASNITVAASDVAKWLSNGTNWHLVSYKRFNGRAIVTEVSEDTTPQAGGNFSMNSHMMQFSKGADIASATSLTLGSDGNSFDVTGTTPITSIGAKAVGTWSQLHFDGALLLTHHATNLILQGGANITTAAGDIALIFEYASGQYRVIYHRASGLPVVSGSAGKVVNAWLAESTSVFSTATTIPRDNTIPQSTEGAEILTATITPTSTGDYLKFTVSCWVDGSAANNAVFAIFKDSGADAIYTTMATIYAAGYTVVVTFTFLVAITSTSSQTWKLRAGPSSAGTLYLNQYTGAVAEFSTTDKITMLIEQVTLT